MTTYRFKGNGIYEAKIVVKTLLVTAFLGVLLSLVASCVKKHEDIVPTINSIEEGTSIDVPATRWVIVSPERLRQVYIDAGQEIPEDSEIKGFTGVLEDGTIIIATTQPKHVDDDVTLTVGHEYMHVALGSYHQ